MTTQTDMDFLEASEHHFMCNCDKCRAWWADGGPDWSRCTNNILYFGPFTEQEIETVVGAKAMNVWRRYLKRESSRV